MHATSFTNELTDEANRISMQKKVKESPATDTDKRAGLTGCADVIEKVL